MRPQRLKAGDRCCISNINSNVRVIQSDHLQIRRDLTALRTKEIGQNIGHASAELSIGIGHSGNRCTLCSSHCIAHISR